jgi:hypothetical protein
VLGKTASTELPQTKKDIVLKFVEKEIIVGLTDKDKKL